MQILSFACGVAAPTPAIPTGLLSPPVAVAVLPVVDGIVAVAGWLMAVVDVDELCCRSAAVVTVDVGPAADWARLAMIMSLRVRVPPSAAGGSEVMAAGSEVAVWMSGSFLALNKRILACWG